MSIDFKKLSRVVEDSNSPRTSVRDFQISKNENLLDSLNIEPNKRVFILDDSGINTIMALPRSKRRDILSRLSDSQRRKVFSRYKELQGKSVIKDEKSLSEETLVIVNGNDLACNYAFSRDPYFIPLIEQYISIYGDDLDLEPVINVLNDLVDKDVVSDEHLESFHSLMNEKNLTTGIDAALEASGVQENSADELPKEPVSEDILSDEELKSILEEAKEDSLKIYKGEKVEKKYINDSLKAEAYYSRLSSNLKSHVLRLKALVGAFQSQRLRDSVIEDIVEGGVFDDFGDEIVTEDKKSILQLTTEAIQSYVNGDPEPLKKLSEMNLEGESVNSSEESSDEPSDDSSKESGDTSEDSNDDSSKVDEEPSDDDASEDLSLKDSVALSKAILSSSNNLNSIIDSLIDKLPILKSVNLKVSDSDFGYTAYEQPAPFGNPPLSASEYNSVACACPDYLIDLVSSDKVSCPYVNEYDCNDFYITINKEGLCQKWIPTSCSIEEVKSKLASAEQSSWNGIIQECCVPLDKYCSYAAMTDNLHAIDNSFYKRNPFSKEWCFDSVPNCLKNIETIKDNGKIVYGSIEGGIKVNLFGTQYSILP